MVCLFVCFLLSFVVCKLFGELVVAFGELDFFIP